MWETAKASIYTSGRLDTMQRKKKNPSLMGVGDVVKMESSHPLMIYMPIVCFVFPTNISDLLGRSQDKLEFCGSGVPSEWMSNFKGCFERFQIDLMVKLSLWLGTNEL